MPAPFVLSSDLVSAYPAKSVTLADYIDTALASKTDTAMVQNAQTGVSYSFALADASKLLTTSNASPVSVTVTKQATVTWVTGTQLRIINLGAGVTTLVADTGVTINNNVALKQYQGGELIRTASDVWLFVPTASSSGMDLITATTFSASAAVNLNNVFTSANALYLVTGSVTMSGTDRPKFRMRVGGVDASGGSDYTFGWLDGSGATATAATGSTSFWMPFAGTSNVILTFTFQLLNPATAVFTQLLNSAGFDPTPRIRTGSARHGVATAYDGFSITPETGGTMTGAVYVYKLQTT
jgi:hypothetical protein